VGDVVRAYWASTTATPGRCTTSAGKGVRIRDPPTLIEFAWTSRRGSPHLRPSDIPALGDGAGPQATGWEPRVPDHTPARPPPIRARERRPRRPGGAAPELKAFSRVAPFLEERPDVARRRSCPSRPDTEGSRLQGLLDDVEIAQAT
jgi:hypothetical protein